jgi:hypothetical protein
MRKEIFILILFFIPFISADILSLNSGGTGNIILNPSEYIEGFFWGDVCVPYTCVSLGYNCGVHLDGCGSTIDCGSCGTGYSCSSGVCVSDSGTPSGPGGPGGPEFPPIVVQNLEVSPANINVNLAVNTNLEQLIQIKNLGSSVNISISSEGLGNRVLIEEQSISLNTGETKTIKVLFVASSQTGIFTGNLLVGQKKIPIAMNVKSKLLLFDSAIEVLNENAQVKSGGKLKTKITLIPMGDPSRLDVFLNYTIEDYNGTIYFSKTESVLVEEQMEFERTFSTNKIPAGSYIIGFVLSYPNGIAPASDHFEIVSNLFGKIILILIILILIVLITLIVFIIWKRRQEEEEEE